MSPSLREARPLLGLAFGLLVLGVLLPCGALAAARVAAADDNPIRWTEAVRALWPIVITLTGLAAACVMLALGQRFATNTALRKLSDRLDAIAIEASRHDGRIQRVEEQCSTSPSRMELQEDIAELGARMTGVEKGLDGVGDQLSTTNTYLHSLIEQGLRR